MKNKNMIPENQKFLFTTNLLELGFSYYKISKLIEEGKIIKLNRSTYENCNYKREVSDFYYAFAYVPSGIACLMSAAVYYDLSTYQSDRVDVAIERKKKVTTLPKWPEIHIHYFDRIRYNTGVETIIHG